MLPSVQNVFPGQLQVYGQQMKKRGQITPAYGLESLPYTPNLKIPIDEKESYEEELSDLIDKLPDKPYLYNDPNINLDPKLADFLYREKLPDQILPVGDLKSFDHLRYVQEGLKNYNKLENIYYDDLTVQEILLDRT